MAYELQFNEGDGIVELCFHGHGDHGEHAASRDEAFKVCRAHRTNNLLVDIRDAVMDLSPPELFEFGKSLEKARDPENIRIAVIIREADTAPDIAAAVAQSRNVTIRVFLTKDDARSWLMA